MKINFNIMTILFTFSFIIAILISGEIRAVDESTSIPTSITGRVSNSGVNRNFYRVNNRTDRLPDNQHVNQLRDPHIGPAQKSNVTWMITQGEYRQLPRETQFQYMQLLFENLSAAEKKVKSTCIVAGLVFPKTPFSQNKCQIQKNTCPRGQVPCALYFGAPACVDQNAKGGTTAQCAKMIQDKKKITQIFESPQVADTWWQMSKGIYEHCNVDQKDKHCQELRSKTQELKSKAQELKSKAQELKFKIQNIKDEAIGGVSQIRIEKKFFSFYSFIFGSYAIAAETCSYNNDSNVFTDRNGREIQFNFARRCCT